MKRLFPQQSKHTDWEKFSGIKQSKTQKELTKELQEQIEENGVYTIFDESNSKPAMMTRLKERKDAKWQKAGVIIAGISVLIAITTIIINI